MAVAPAKGVSLAEIRELNRRLLASGASIHEINETRKRVDRLKGGGMELPFRRVRVTLRGRSMVLYLPQQGR